MHTLLIIKIEKVIYVNHQSLIKHDRKMFYKYVSNIWHYLLITIKSNNQRFARRKKNMNNNRIYNWKSTWRNVMNYRQFKCMVNDSKNPMDETYQKTKYLIAKIRQCLLIVVWYKLSWWISWSQSKALRIYTNRLKIIRIWFSLEWFWKIK